MASSTVFEAIGAEIVDETSVFCYLIPINAEISGDDPLNPLADITHRFPTFFKKGRSGGRIKRDPPLRISTIGPGAPGVEAFNATLGGDTADRFRHYVDRVGQSGRPPSSTSPPGSQEPTS